MAKASISPQGLPPAALLALFCVTALLLFGDRGAIGSNSVNGAPAVDGKGGYGIQGDFDISLAADGFVATALFVGLMLSAPAAALLAKRVNATRLVGWGQLCWMVGTLGSGLAPTFPALLLARLLVGAGSGPFIAVAAPLIDDRAPRGAKSLWLATLFLCFPTGFACGYIYGGLIGTAWGWRTVFLLEAAAMAPLAVLCLLGPAADIRRQPADSGAANGAGSSSSEGGSGGSGTEGRAFSKALGVLWADLSAICRHPTTPLTILALSLFNGALGGYAYYGPKAARDTFQLNPQTGDLLFGAITVATGVLGTLSGGLALDCAGASVRNALRICAAGVAAGCVLVLVAFAAARTLLPFALCFGVGEWAMFLMAAPSSAVLMWAVPPDLRPFSLSVAEVMQHLLGDIPSPPLLGWLQGAVGNWRLTMCVCTALLAAAAALFAAAGCFAHTALHYQDPVPIGDEELDLGGGLEAGSGAGAEPGGSLAQPLLAGHSAAEE